MKRWRIRRRESREKRERKTKQELDGNGFGKDREGKKTGYICV